MAWSTANDESLLIGDGDGGGEGGKLGAKIVSGMWATRSMLKNPDPQLFVKVTLRELILYCIFMLVISYREALFSISKKKSSYTKPRK